MPANTTTLTPEQREVIYHAWIAALRSGLYKQGRKYLESDGKFCCLGVLCHILHQRPELGVEMLRHGGPYGVAEYSTPTSPWYRNNVPYSSAYELGLSTRVPSAEHRAVEAVLVDLNDVAGASFAEIAQFIEGSVMPLLRAKGILPPAQQEAPEKDHETHENTTAARLIAAAPELLAALEGMEKWASSIYDGFPPSTASIAAAPYRAAAQAAIAKATGRSEMTYYHTAMSAGDNYSEWRDFYTEKVSSWMSLEELRAECGKLTTTDATSPELLLIHAMHALEECVQRNEAMPSKSANHQVQLTETLVLTECWGGFWLYDKTRGMNLSMRAQTPQDAFVEALCYYQRRLAEVEMKYRELETKVNAFVEQFIEPQED